MKAYRLTNTVNKESKVFVSGLEGSNNQSDTILLNPNEVRVISASGGVFKTGCCDVIVERIDSDLKLLSTAIGDSLKCCEE